MKEILQQHTAYNVWAHQRMFETMRQLSNDQVHFVIPSSFSSIYKTVLHLLDAESIWWQRMKLHERIVRPSDNFNSSMKDVSNGLLHQDQQWQEWVNTATEPVLDHVFQYYTAKNEMFKQPIFQMLLDVFNHGTSHRGQLVNMLRQLGVEKIPPAACRVWSRKS